MNFSVYENHEKWVHNPLLNFLIPGKSSPNTCSKCECTHLVEGNLLFSESSRILNGKCEWTLKVNGHLHRTKSDFCFVAA